MLLPRKLSWKISKDLVRLFLKMATVVLKVRRNAQFNVELHTFFRKLFFLFSAFKNLKTALQKGIERLSKNFLSEFGNRKSIEMSECSGTRESKIGIFTSKRTEKTIFSCPRHKLSSTRQLRFIVC